MTVIGATARPLGLWFVACLLAVAAVVSSPGLFNTDELIYYHGARAIAENGSFVVRNGYELFQAEGLRLWFLVVGPDGLVPQYPAGYALAGAPLVGLLSERGLILLNAGAAIATVFLCRALARRLYGDDVLAIRAALILALATFLTEYALGIWPHAIGAGFVTAALLVAVQAVSGPPDRALRSAVLTGLLIGVGMLFRVDTVLILPPLVLWAILVARRPFGLFGAAALGLLPGLAAGTLLNWIKFGLVTPITYGSSGGNTDLASYLGLGAACLLGLLGALGLRQAWRRPQWRRPAAATVLLVLAGSLLFPMVRHTIAELASGSVALLLDITAIDIERAHATVRADGTLSFWGLNKKALGQSLPWIGALAFLLVLPWRREDRSSDLLCLLVIVCWPLPFLLREWHGGFGSNMRYFLPMLPVLAILVSHVWRDLTARAETGRVVDGLLGCGLGLLGLFAVVALHPGGLNAAQQVAASWLLFATAAASAVAALPVGAAALRARIARVIIAMGFAFGCAFGVVLDPLVAQSVRAGIQDLNAAFSDIPDRSLIFGKPAEAFSFQIARPDGLLVSNPSERDTVDTVLINDALERGYRTYIYTAERLARVLAADPTLAVVGTVSAGERYTLYELARSPPRQLP